MLNDVIYANTPDKDTQAIRSDAEALERNLDNHAAGGGPSSPENVASFRRFRSFYSCAPGLIAAVHPR